MQINPLDHAGLAWWRMAVLYFVAGVSLGIGMGLSGDHKLFGVHAHINLTGWVSLALIGLIYQHLPELGRNGVARMQFWIHNLGLPVMMIGLAAQISGYPQLLPLLAGGAFAVGISVLLFAYNMLFNLRT
jgi:hypothetical protein